MATSSAALLPDADAGKPPTSCENSALHNGHAAKVLPQVQMLARDRQHGQLADREDLG
jgi:hypothetical protein